MRMTDPQGSDLPVGCRTHSTPAGQTCSQCRDQGELFSRADVAKLHRYTPRRS